MKKNHLQGFWYKLMSIHRLIPYIMLYALLTPMYLQAQTNAKPVPPKAALCTACHGPQGNSITAQWPNLAGQHAAYTLKQLQDIKIGKTRKSATMAAIVAGLNEEEMEALAEYYESQPLAEGSVPQKYVARGEALYRGGDLDKHTSACIACHGPNGRGNAQAGFPSLSGQKAAYTIAQLQDFKKKARSNDYNGIMRDISARLEPEDQEALAFYMQGLY